MGVALKRRLIAQLLAGQRPDGGFGVHPYSKWKGAHWRLVSLVELGVSPANRAARKAAGTVLDWLAGPRWQKPVVVAGLERRHASMEGNALAVCCRLGMAGDRRVQSLADVLLRAQWPDGGWNCDRNPTAHRSSFHETLAPVWGLAEYHRGTGDAAALVAATHACELLLEHRLFLSSRTGSPINSEWAHIHWPHYWHYDFFHGLRAVAQFRKLSDPRTQHALELLRSKRRPDGTWQATGRRYWRTSTEVVDWGDAQEIITGAAKAILRESPSAGSRGKSEPRKPASAGGRAI